MKNEPTRALRRHIAVSDSSVIALRHAAEVAGANDQPMAVVLLNIADMLDGATQCAIHSIAHEPTVGDSMQFKSILGQIRAYAPPQAQETGDAR